MPMSTYINSYKIYLQLEKALSANTIEAYIRDVLLLQKYLDELCDKTNIIKEMPNKRGFIYWPFCRYVCCS